MNNQNSQPSPLGPRDDFRRQVDNHRYAQQRPRRPKAIERQKQFSCSYEISLRLGDRVNEFKSGFEIPQFDASYPAGVIADCEQLVDLLIKKPLLAALTAYQQEQTTMPATGKTNESSVDSTGWPWATIVDDYPSRLPDKPRGNQPPANG